MAKQTTETTQATVDVATGADPKAELARLQAEQRAMAERVKALKAALPKQTPLEKAVAQQTANPADVIARLRVLARIKAGQDRALAIADVLELTRNWLEGDIPNE